MTLLTRRQLQEAISLSRNGIQALVQRGMPQLRIGPKTIRYDWEAVKRWMEEQSKKHTDDSPPAETNEEA